MGKQESMTSGERSDLHLDRPPGGAAPEAGLTDTAPEAALTNTAPGGAAPEAGITNTAPEAALTNTAPEAGLTDTAPEARLTNTAPEAATAGWPRRWATRGRWGTWVGAMSRGRRLALTAAVAVLAVAAAIWAIGSTPGGPAKPHSNPRAPAFTLARLGHSGEHISLAGVAGRPVILNFFASWCVPCQKETPLLARFYRAAHGSVTLIGVDANDKTAAALKFTHAAGVSYPVGFDPYPMHTTLSYGVAGLPQTFFLDARHRIVKRVFGAVTEQELRAGVALMKRG